MKYRGRNMLELDDCTRTWHIVSFVIKADSLSVSDSGIRCSTFDDVIPSGEPVHCS